MSDTNSVGQDEVFKQEINRVSDFKFGTQVVNVFDDMVSRSVPYYGEIQRMMAELSADHAQPGTNIYDLGLLDGGYLYRAERVHSAGYWLCGDR